MKQEKSCGAVIFRQRGWERYCLVIHSTLGHWGLCKGHVEGDETERETAKREIMEETGLSVEFVRGFRQVITYSPSPDSIKDVVFFLARTQETAVTCQPEEVSEAMFLPFADAMAKLTYPSDRDVLAMAEAFLFGR